jgi:SAM-dependent methyltransferase
MHQDTSSDLTSPSYWGERQKSVKVPAESGALKELIDAIEPFLQPYEGQRWVELGCSPGRMSALLYQRVRFIPHGVDFSPEAHLYKLTMSQVAGVEATLYRCDLRTFQVPQPFDVVMSFGLLEHFSDTEEILDHHYRLCREKGLLVVNIPNFRYLQWLYHYAFDRTDLERHNVGNMRLDTFREFAERKSLDVLFLRHVGRMHFWNVDEKGPWLLVLCRRALSLLIRGSTELLLSKLLPANKRLYSPWIVFVARLG